jgi:hypothetical protein
MPLTSVHSKGIALQKGNGASPEVFATIGGINDMPEIMSQKSTVEDTSIDDDNRHYNYGIGEPPGFTLTVFWNPDDANQTALITEHDSETESNYRVLCPDDSPSTTYTFKAIVTGYGTPQAGINGLLTQNFQFQLNENDDGKIVTKGTES